jgi:hypothetical protein
VDRLERGLLARPLPGSLELAELAVQPPDLGEDTEDPPELALRELGAVEGLQVLVRSRVRTMGTAMIARRTRS